MQNTRFLWPLVILIVFGLLYRLWPIVAGMPALANFFITEDGYLMLTVARNMAIGEGMSVSAGTIPTNGVQPLIAFIFAVPYWFSDGDKVSSLISIHLIHAAIALAAVFAIRRFASHILAPRDAAPIWAWGVGVLWFLGPLLLRHSMNGLETGLYTLVALTTLLVFARVLDQGEGASTRLRLGLGAMCGLVVLARNDAVFLVAALFAVWAVIELFVTRQGVFAMITRLVGPGLLSIAVAAPWLINNMLRFGSIVPVSGTAQNMSASFGQNASLLPSKLFETGFPMLPIPAGLETNPMVIALTGGLLGLCVLVLIWRVMRHASLAGKALVFACLGHGAALAFYYGYFFGAPHFLSRYMAPLAPFLIVAALATALECGRWLIRARPDALAWAYVSGGLVLSLALLIRAAMPGVTLQGHEQIVAWTRDNVPQETWVGAVQTGTLGYWHDRTYNLDGKVNPEALAARQTEGHVLNYVTQSQIDYVIDWAEVGNWVTFPEAADGFGAAFETIVQDRDANLSVMKRTN